MPSLTRPSPTTNGTTMMLTSGVLKLGARMATSTVLPPTAARLPTRRPLRTSTATLRATVARPATAKDTVARLFRVRASRLTATARRRPTGAVPLLTVKPPRVLTTPTPSPSRPTALMRTADGASLTTASLLALTATKSTPDGSRLMTTSGLRTTTPIGMARLVRTARALPPTPPPAPAGASPSTTRRPPLTTSRPTGTTRPPTGMRGAAIRTSTRRFPTM
mmetsp:Transcript_33294/g.43863  ORF Transcript_33294/g.43863 Transcript_33294/m.43863 type:complete len:221 (+) Transcript_33294:536-1198(+)